MFIQDAENVIAICPGASPVNFFWRLKNEHNHHGGFFCRTPDHYFVPTAGGENMEKQVSL
jgi:hypothetical protein